MTFVIPYLNMAYFIVLSCNIIEREIKLTRINMKGVSFRHECIQAAFY